MSEQDIFSWETNMNFSLILALCETGGECLNVKLAKWLYKHFILIFLALVHAFRLRLQIA